MTKFNTALFPKKEEIHSWICDLAQWGHRKTGTPESRKSAEYIAGKFKEFGMEDIAIETVPSACMFCEDYSLQIDGKEYESFYANGTNRGAEEGTFKFGYDDDKQDFVYLGEGHDTDFEGVDVEGRIVVCSVRFKDNAHVKHADWFDAAYVYDPEGKIDDIKGVKPDIYSPNNWPGNYFTAIKKGAVGFVGILEDYMDDPYWYCEDYTEIGHVMGIEYMRLPALWVSRSDGKEIKKAFEEKGILGGTMKMQSTYKYCDALNVKGVLPGMSDEIILVHSHHDAVFEGAVQDASGISEMLAIGKYFSRIEKAERPKTMMFAATDTHYTDYMGHQGFIKQRKANGDNIILDIVTEHIGKEVVLDENGNMMETGEVEDRLMYITNSTGMYDFVIDTFKKYNLEKTTFASVEIGGQNDGEYEFHQDEVISDGYYFSEAGIPVISHVAGQIYIFHPSDKPDRVAMDQLEPIGMAFTEIALEAAKNYNCGGDKTL